ncbi:antitoxin [uncultured Acinetobacter sp.]|uniref:antitoxin n=1 Tax=uncultured Acinetobacter sp. TaxID=165433 RepID=UPI0025E594DC|nr:type II toxin-antitoxin system VapB family antitoxin [uncultured Acinetobacter sp.]
MKITKIFQTSQNQVVRLPKTFHFNGTEVAIKSFGRSVLLMPIENPWDIMLDAVNEFKTGFQPERADQGEQVREDFK